MLKGRNSLLLKFLVFISDAAILFLSASVSAICLKIWLYGPILTLSVVYGIIIFPLMHAMGLYGNTNRKRIDIFLSVILSSLVSILSTLIIGKILSPEYFSNLYILLTGCVNFVIILIWRILFSKMFIKFVGKETMLVIEAKNVDNKMARKIKYSCLDMFDSWYTQIDTEDFEAFEEFLKTEFTHYQNIFITNTLPSRYKRHLMAEAIAAGKEVYLLPELYDINLIKYETVQFDDTPSFHIKHFGPTAGQAIIKRGFDIVVASAGLVLLSPLIGLISLGIKISSPGPIFYIQDRITKGNHIFKIHKFRTMIKDAEKFSGPILACETDPRITPFGKFLRRARLDELPQLINILKGDMSLVGPRPERPFFVEQFCRTIKNYDKRYVVKPGLTGYAQVYAKYNTDVSDKLIFDLIYIREYSFWLDIKILLLTLKVIFQKDASSGIKDKQVENKFAK
ncbi:MAG: sugar transferase [Bacillota bacterium]|nr:sugar transferase [Bacillota bacterium]